MTRQGRQPDACQGRIPAGPDAVGLREKSGIDRRLGGGRSLTCRVLVARHPPLQVSIRHHGGFLPCGVRHPEHRGPVSIGEAGGWHFPDALRSLDDVWTPESLAQFLGAPRQFAPGTFMGPSGLTESEARAVADYIAGPGGGQPSPSTPRGVRQAWPSRPGARLRTPARPTPLRSLPPRTAHPHRRRGRPRRRSRPPSRPPPRRGCRRPPSSPRTPGGCRTPLRRPG